MFGYVRTLAPELKVKEAEFYRGIYCGLCRAMGRCTGCMSRLSLSYDITFLAAVRLALSSDGYSLVPHRCVVHPWKKRIMMEENETLCYCAGVSALLTEEKFRDDVSDSGFFKRFAHGAMFPIVRRAVKKSGIPNELRQSVRHSLEELYELEKEKCDSLDRMANVFGNVLSLVFSFGLDGSSQRIASEIGKYTGRFIYVADAADDLPEDIKCRGYNPVFLMWGDSAFSRGDKGEVMLSSEVADQLYTATLMDLSGLSSAVSLIDFYEKENLRAVIENIIYLGMPHKARSIYGINDGFKF